MWPLSWREKRTKKNGSLMNAKHSSIQIRPIGIATRFIGIVSAVAPGLRSRMHRALVRTMYSGISFVLKNEDSAFLNYGYTPHDSNTTKLELLPEDEADRLSIQLYSRIAGARELRGKDVLEIGCGRGGGASFIARYLQPAALTGVDLSARAVRYCRKRHRSENLKFLRGDAEHLPYPANSFDAVVNVESSHCYPSFERFLTEVARVLRPDGCFLFADMRPREEVARMLEQLKERFVIVEEEVITTNVVHALELDSDRRNLLIQKRAPRFLHKGLQLFGSVSGSPIFEALSAGSWQYVRLVLKKMPVN
uniref:Methyltransferase type 11 n=1 Tax=Solibacter usitatus (strain Ellin6076) TaxID=234267 RepID=Q01V47_SOLUE